MGQRASRTARRHSEVSDVHTDSAVHVAVFPTDLGWSAACGRGRAVMRLTIGHGAAEAALDELELDELAPAGEWKRDSDWWPELRMRLQRYAQGRRAEFQDLAVELPPMTAFQRAVVEAARGIPYGATVSYSELAARAGFPRAARAVGSVMARCRVPILIPCHRVISAGGKVGGYGSRSGVALKQRLLDLEAGHSCFVKVEF